MSSGSDAFRLLREKIPALRLEQDALLREHTSFHVGGPAAMAFPHSADELQSLLALTAEYALPIRILGAGTNILAPDEGVEELVVCLKDSLTGLRSPEDGKIEAYAGEALSKAAVFARSCGLSGMEFAHGIPGSVGGGVYMNAGAYGAEMAQITESTTVFMKDGSQREYIGAEQDFSYRHSVFEKTDCVIVRSVFRLTPGEPEQIRQTMRTLMEKRKASQPLELASAGSTFKRPQGYYAGRLIEQAGLKGKGFGDARVSEKHAGFVVNLGTASAEDIRKTISFVQETVYKTFGVFLEPEVQIWQVK